MTYGKALKKAWRGYQIRRLAWGGESHLVIWMDMLVRRAGGVTSAYLMPDEDITADDWVIDRR